LNQEFRTGELGETIVIGDVGRTSYYEMSKKCRQYPQEKSYFFDMKTDNGNSGILCIVWVGEGKAIKLRMKSLKFEVIIK
jgi:hypothetical protein